MRPMPSFLREVIVSSPESVAFVTSSMRTFCSGSGFSPRMSLSASSTASRPISEGNCATDPSIVPAAIAWRASPTASKPMTRILPVLPAAAIASTAPSAIMSLHAKSASISGCACSMFWNTVKPWSRSQFAVCEATTVTPGASLTASWKPLSRESPVSWPGMPSSSPTLAFPPVTWIRYSPATLPPS